MNTFTKNDLVPGKHIVKFHNGEIGIVLIDETNEKYIHTKENYLMLDDLSDTLVNNFNPKYTIDAIYTLHTPIYIFELYKGDYEYFLKEVWKRDNI